MIHRLTKTGLNLNFKIHLMLPGISNDGQLCLRLKRMVEFTMIPELTTFLLDHGRPRTYLFEKLQSKHLTLVYSCSGTFHWKPLSSDWPIFDIKFRIFE